MELDSMEDVFLRDNAGPTIAEHSLKCSNSFKKYMVMPAILSDPTLIDDQHARFMLWASNMDVFGPPHVSLDYRLRYSPTIVEIIHQLLDVISDSLNYLQPIDDLPLSPSMKKRRILGAANMEVTKRADDDSSDKESDYDQGEKNVYLISDIIGGTVTRLFRLSNAIRKSAKASRTTRIDGYRYDEETNNAVAELRNYTESYIRFRFPQAPEALRSALVEANALRLRRLCYQRSHRRRIALSFQNPQSGPTHVQTPIPLASDLAIQSAQSIPPKPKIIDKNLNPKQAGPPPAPMTYATTARQTAVRDIFANSVMEVPRAKSILVNNKLSFPPVPTTSECPYCGVVVEFEKTAKLSVWNEHVLRDLEPFVCLFPPCIDSANPTPGSLTFETSNAWMSHMQSAHGYVWECRAPSHDPMIYEDEAEFQKHSCNEHGVPEAHVGTLSGAARRPALEKILECPFGDDFSAPENADKSNLFLNGALHQHVATHMKQIALLALQKLPHGDEEDCEDVASDAPLDDVRFPELRRSMYSLLDDETLEFEDTVEDGVSNTLEDRIMSSVGRLGLEDRDLEGMTKLHRAVRDNEFMVVQSLIEQGANLRSTSNDGRTVLHYASIDRSKGVEMIKLLLNSNAQEALGLVDEDGQTPLHYAAKAGFADAADLLIASGLSADSLDRFGFSPFIWAVIVGDITATRLFLSHGSNANSTSSDGKSALSWAASLGHTLIVELILEMRAEVMSATTKARLIPLEEAAAYGDVRTVQFLLHFGADPNYRDRDGWSAIHWAAEQGHRDVLLLLFEHGADIHAVSAYGTSVLHCAANGGHSDIVTELLQHGADPNKSTCHGWTPLHHAAFMGHSRVVRALLESNRITSSPAQDNHGWSALHLATHRRQLDTVIALLENSDIQKAYAQCDESGLTAEEWLDLEFESHSYKTIRELAFDKSRCCRAVTKLRQAIRDNHIVLAQVFLNQGCDINGTDSGNRTALYYSATAGDLSTVDMLLQCGADPNIIPDGYRSWEEFISDDTIMQRLRRAGHQGMTFDPEIDYQIRFALLKRGRNHALSQQPSRLSLQPASRSRLRDIFWGRRKSTTPEKKTGTEK